MSTHSSTAVHQATRAPSEWRTSGLIQLTRPQTIGTLSGLMLSMLLAALDQTIVGTAEPKIIASLSGFDRYPWVSLLCLDRHWAVGSPTRFHGEPRSTSTYLWELSRSLLCTFIFLFGTPKTSSATSTGPVWLR